MHYPAAAIAVVPDTLSTHSSAALDQTFPPADVRRLVKRLEFHYTPRHRSWLNMAELEFAILTRQCLDRRLLDRAMFQRAKPLRRATGFPLDNRVMLHQP